MATITDRTVGKKPTGQEEWITEDAPRGYGRFCLRITKAGKKIFYFRYAGPDRAQVRLPLGGYDPTGKFGLTLREARARASELSRLYHEGVADIKGYVESDLRIQEARRIAEEARLDSERLAAEAALSRLTVEGLFEKWASAQLSRRKDGGAELTRIFKKDVIPAIGSMFADEVKKGHIAEIVDNVLSRGANRLAKMVFASLRQMFAYAVYRDWLDVDPTAKIRKADIGGKDAERNRVLNDNEIKLLNEKMPEAGLSPTAEAAVWIALSTCCRIGELLSARWEHVDLEGGNWLIPAENSKNGAPLEVHLSGFALEHFRVIRTINGGLPWLFPNRDKTGPVSSKTITKQLGDRQRTTAMKNRSAATKTLVLPGGKWTPHDLRRTGATIMATLGIAPVVIEKCLNHTEQNKVQRIYQRYSYVAEMKRAWDSLGERLEVLTERKGASNVIHLMQKAR